MINTGKCLSLVAFISVIFAITLFTLNASPVDGEDNLELIPKRHVKAAGGSLDWECYGNDTAAPTYIECYKKAPTPTPTPGWCHVAWSGGEPGKLAYEEPVRVANWQLNLEKTAGEYKRWDSYESDEQKSYRLEHGWKICSELPN